MRARVPLWPHACVPAVPAKLGIAEHGRVIGAPGRNLAVRAHQPAKIDARHGVRGDGPDEGDLPVGAIHQERVGLKVALGLHLRCAPCVRYARDQTRPCAAVVTHPVDIHAVQTGVRLDLYVQCLARGEAHLRAEALDRGVARAIDVPLGRGRAFFLVLERDLRRRRSGGARLLRRRGDDAERDGEQIGDHQTRDNFHSHHTSSCVFHAHTNRIARGVACGWLVGAPAGRNATRRMLELIFITAPLFAASYTPPGVSQTSST